MYFRFKKYKKPSKRLKIKKTKLKLRSIYIKHSRRNFFITYLEENRCIQTLSGGQCVKGSARYRQHSMMFAIDKIIRKNEVKSLNIKLINGDRHRIKRLMFKYKFIKKRTKYIHKLYKPHNGQRKKKPRRL